MSKTPFLITIAAVGAIAIAAASLIVQRQDQDAVNARFGQGHATSVVFLPAAPRKESRIVRHPQADGSAVDDVLMRDGTTKTIVYDKKMTLRQVTSFYKGSPDQEHGPVMYEKTHDERGHLSAERHLRADGSLEMDGHFNPDTTYERHLYYPGHSADPKDLVVSTYQVFDKWWHFEAQTDYRYDGTKQLEHKWGDGSDETYNYFADDGKTQVKQVVTKRGSWYTALFYPDGVNIKVEALNNLEGTTFQWYRLDHSLLLKVTYQTNQSDEILLTTEQGKLAWKQVWYKDYNQKSVDGVYPKRLEHVDHYNDQGEADIRYEFQSLTKKLMTVTYFEGDKVYGKRTVYSIAPDGVNALTVQHFDDDNKGDGGKPAVGALKKSFNLPSQALAYPAYELPPLKEGLSLYGQQYMYYGHP